MLFFEFQMKLTCIGLYICGYQKYLITGNGFFRRFKNRGKVAQSTPHLGCLEPGMGYLEPSKLDLKNNFLRFNENSFNVFGVYKSV